MTLIRNNPRSKYIRRISAAERLEKLITSYENYLATELSAEYVQGSPQDVEKQDFFRKLSIAKRELIVLKERIAKGGSKSTKKSGANIGRRMA